MGYEHSQNTGTVGYEHSQSSGTVGYKHSQNTGTVGYEHSMYEAVLEAAQSFPLPMVDLCQSPFSLTSQWLHVQN